MEMETVSVASMIGMGVSMLLSMGIPVGLLIYGKVKKDAKFSSFFIGAGTFFVFAMVLEQILHMVVLGGFPDIQNNIWLYGLYGAAAAAVFEETGRFVAMKFLMKKNLDFKNGFMYGVGHGGIEAILIGGMSGISNLMTSVMINSGTLQKSLEVLDDATKEATLQQISALWTSDSYLFYISGIERAFAIFLQIGLSVLVYLAVKKGKWGCLALAYVLHFAVDFVAVVSAKYINVIFVEVIIMVFAIAVLLLARALAKKYPEEGNI